MAKDELANLIVQTAVEAISVAVQQAVEARKTAATAGAAAAARVPHATKRALASGRAMAETARNARLPQVPKAMLQLPQAPKVENPKRAGAVAAIVAGAAVGAGVAAAIVRADAHVRWRTQSGPMVVFTRSTDSGDRLRVMVAGGVYQSATYLDHRWNRLPFEYYRAFDRAFDAPIDVKRVLMLGGGGFAYPKHLLTSRADVIVDVVESDPQVIALALDYFYLDRLMDVCPDRLRVVQEEGLAYLQATDCTYDVIVNDAFRGAAPDAGLATVEGARMAHARLNPGGLYLVNVVAYPGDAKGYGPIASLVGTLGQVFEHVWVLPSTDHEFSGEENYLVIASDTPCDYPDAIPY